MKSIISVLLLLFLNQQIYAHHVLGISQTGKITESPQIPGNMELYIGDFFVNITVLPGHPDPHKTTRIISYTKNLKTNMVFLGKMEFNIVRTNIFGLDRPFSKEIKTPIEDRHIQLVEFSREGTYEIKMGFTDKGKAYSTSFELLVGQPLVLWKYAIGILVLILLGGILWKAKKNRKKLESFKEKWKKRAWKLNNHIQEEIFLKRLLKKRVR
jgi:hypothetical protein